MSEPVNNPNPQPIPAPTLASTPTHAPAPAPVVPPEKTFTQAELDTIVGKRLAKAMKGMPSEEEMKDYRAWKESQQTEKDRWDNLTKERDTARTELTAAQAELEQYKREKYLLGKGVPADDVDYYAFKIGKLVTETMDFEKAAEAYLKENPPAGTVQVDLSAPLGTGQPAKNENEMMNSLIRRARN